MSADTDTLRIIDLGRMAYAPSLEIQRKAHAQVVADELPPTVFLVEHDPVITVSQRKAASQHLLASRDQLASLGIDVQETDRGGDVTYHGPGQLVVYPIIRLTPLGLNIGRYMRLLEQIAIDAIAPFGINGVRDKCATGVWVEMTNSIPDERLDGNLASSSDACGLAGTQPTAKLAALGVRVSRGVTLHGLALNVTTNLAHFNTIVPCGLLHRTVTSLQQLLGDRTPAMDAVKSEMSKSVRRHLSH